MLKVIQIRTDGNVHTTSFDGYHGESSADYLFKQLKPSPRTLCLLLMDGESVRAKHLHEGIK